MTKVRVVFAPLRDHGVDNQLNKIIPEGLKKLAGGQGAKRRHPRFVVPEAADPGRGRRIRPVA
jgi:hypothetical protein